MAERDDAEAALRRPRRWAVLFAFVLVVGVSQMLWLNFAPLLSLLQTRYGVSEVTASSLIIVFPLLYVVLSLPAGVLIDRRGYRIAVGLGAVVMAAASCIRIFDGNFAYLLAGQIGIAIAQPFIVNGMPKLVADWFSEEQGAIATGLGTVGMFVGMALGLALTPALQASLEMAATMAVFAGISIAAAVVFLLVVRPNELAPPAAEIDGGTGFGVLLRDRGLVLLSILSFLGLGVFNGLTTWLEQILAPRGVDAEKAGLVGAALIGGGIVGAVVIPALSDATRRRKPFLIGCAAAALVTLYPMCMSKQYGVIVGVAALHGFLFLPAYALLLEMSGQISGKERAGAATSLLMLAGNAGGVVVVRAMAEVKGAAADFDRAVLLLLALLAVTVVLAFLAPETFPRHRGGARSSPG